jgi:AraC-like DNA-binding protein
VLIRSEVLHKYAWVADTLGFDGAHYFDRVGVREARSADEDAFIAFSSLAELLEITAAEVPCPDLGMRMAQVPRSFFENPLTVLVQHAATLREAVRLASLYKYAFCPKYTPLILPRADNSGLTDITVSARESETQQIIQATEFAVASLVRLVGMMTAHEPVKVTALFPHSRQASPATYEQHLKCPALFDQSVAGIRLESSALDARLPAHSDLRARMAIEYIETKFNKVSQLVTTQVQQLLKQKLGNVLLTQEVIAVELSLHVKTLQRRLSNEGTCFATLLDCARKERFLELLSQPARPQLGRIAQLLGYAEQAALSRSCQRWFNSSPSDLLRLRSIEVEKVPVGAPVASWIGASQGITHDVQS